MKDEIPALTQRELSHLRSRVLEMYPSAVCRWDEKTKRWILTITTRHMSVDFHNPLEEDCWKAAAKLPNVRSTT